MKSVYVITLSAWLSMVAMVYSHSYFMTTSYCSRSTAVGTSIMGVNVGSSSSRSVLVSRSGTQLTSGATYTPGETLQVTLSNTGNEYLLQTTAGSFSGGGCSGTRYAGYPGSNSAASLVMPASGTVSIIGVFATSYGSPVSRTSTTFVLNPGSSTVSPTSRPTTAKPSASPSMRPSSLPTITPSSVPTVTPSSGVPTTPNPSMVPTINPTPSPSNSPSINPTLGSGQTYCPSALSTNSPTSVPSVKPTALPSSRPTHCPTSAFTPSPTSMPSQSPTQLPTITAEPTNSLEIFTADLVKPVDKSSSVTGSIIIGVVCLSIPVATLFAYISVTGGVPITISITPKLATFVALSYSLGIVAIGLVARWVSNGNSATQFGYLGLPSFNDNPLAWHVALMVGGLFFGQVIAITSWSALGPITTDKDVIKSVHAFFQTGSAGSLIAGLIAIVRHTYINKLENLTTIHSWVGVIATIMFGLTYLFGMLISTLTAMNPENENLKEFGSYHRMSGVITFSLIVIAIATGVNDRLSQGQCNYISSASSVSASQYKYPISNYDAMPDACKLSFGMTISVVVSALFVSAAVYQRTVHLTISDDTKETIALFVIIVIAFITGAAAIILITMWCSDSNSTDQYGYLGIPEFSQNPLAWHVSLMVGGLFYGHVLAILTWAVIPKFLPDSMNTKSKHTVAKFAHFLFNTGSAGCMVAGLVAVVRYLYINKRESLVSMHSWIGVSASSMFGFTYIFGAFMAGLTQFYPDSPIHKAVDLRFFHRFLGVSSSVLVACAIATGVMDQLGQGSCYYIIMDSITASIYKNPVNHYNDIPDACKLAHGAVILVLISTACVGIAVALRPPSFKKPSHTALRNTDIHVGVESESYTKGSRAVTPRAVNTYAL